MPIDQATEQRIRALAQQRGQDPDRAVAEAERVQSGGDSPDGEPAASGTATPGHPTFERLLIGAFPYIKVRELRSIWLGLSERVEDDEMFCGDFAAKHGGGGGAATAPDAPEDA